MTRRLPFGAGGEPGTAQGETRDPGAAVRGLGRPGLLGRLPRPRSAGFPWVTPTWPGGAERPPEEPTLGVDYDTAWARRYGVRLARAMVTDAISRPLVRAIAAPTLEGTERLAGVHGPVIFAANHASHLDTPLLLTSLPERFRHHTVVAAGADYFFDKRWKAAMWAFTIAAIPIERRRVSRRSAELATELLQRGWSLVIFPEGGRSPDGWGQEFTGGAAYLAVRTGAPIVPVHLEGTARILPRHGGRIRPGHTTVTFGHPLRVSEDTDRRSLALRVEREVAALADEQASDWWSARRRAAAGATPSLTGPDTSAWRRTWALERRRRARRSPRRRWPDL